MIKENTGKTPNVLAIENIFENFLKPGMVVEEREIVPGFKIKVRPLSIAEAAIASSPLSTEKYNADSIYTLKAAAYLAKAIVEVNDVPVEDTDESRAAMYFQLGKLPGSVLSKAYEFYLSVVQRQSSLYDTEAIEEELENF